MIFEVFYPEITENVKVGGGYSGYFFLDLCFLKNLYFWGGRDLGFLDRLFFFCFFLYVNRPPPLFFLGKSPPSSAV